MNQEIYFSYSTQQQIGATATATAAAGDDATTTIITIVMIATVLRHTTRTRVDYKSMFLVLVKHTLRFNSVRFARENC